MAGDPRIRGEHEDKRYADWDRAGSSPHTRGARAHRLLKPSGVCIIPTYAGSTTSSPTRWRRPKDHPRIRGEHSSRPSRRVRTVPSSPHTRGALVMVTHTFYYIRIIPAYAGSTGPPPAETQRRLHHPRIRGEHDFARSKTSRRDQSSPHTRGARLRPLKDFAPRPIIPAYAGSTCGRWRRACRWTDHPRIRGEHDFARSKTSRRDQSSPHTRGALPDSQRHDPKGEDHPRIRGEHGGPAYSADDPRRSSPHTRGARIL